MTTILSTKINAKRLELETVSAIARTIIQHGHITWTLGTRFSKACSFALDNFDYGEFCLDAAISGYDDILGSYEIARLKTLADMADKLAREYDPKFDEHDCRLYKLFYNFCEHDGIYNDVIGIAVSAYNRDDYDDPRELFNGDGYFTFADRDAPKPESEWNKRYRINLAAAQQQEYFA